MSEFFRPGWPNHQRTAPFTHEAPAAPAIEQTQLTGTGEKSASKHPAADLTVLSPDSGITQHSATSRILFVTRLGGRPRNATGM